MSGLDGRKLQAPVEELPKGVERRVLIRPGTGGSDGLQVKRRWSAKASQTGASHHPSRGELRGRPAWHQGGLAVLSQTAFTCAGLRGSRWLGRHPLPDEARPPREALRCSRAAPRGAHDLRQSLEGRWSLINDINGYETK